MSPKPLSSGWPLKGLLVKFILCCVKIATDRRGLDKRLTGSFIPDTGPADEAYGATPHPMEPARQTQLSRLHEPAHSTNTSNPAPHPPYASTLRSTSSTTATPSQSSTAPKHARKPWNALDPTWFDAAPPQRSPAPQPTDVIDAIGTAQRSADGSPSAFAEPASFAPTQPHELRALLARSLAHVRDNLLCVHGELAGALAARGLSVRSGADIVAAFACALDVGGGPDAAQERALGALGPEALRANVRALRRLQVALVEDIAGMRRALAEGTSRAENGAAGCGRA